MAPPLRVVSFMLCLALASAALAANQFLPAVVYPIKNKAVFIAVGDFNGDGIPDLAACGEDPLGSGSDYSILLGNGDGTFQRAHTYSDGGSYGIAVADLNRDGKLDLVKLAGVGAITPVGQNPLLAAPSLHLPCC